MLIHIQNAERSSCFLASYVREALLSLAHPYNALTAAFADGLAQLKAKAGILAYNSSVSVHGDIAELCDFFFGEA